MRGKGGFTLVTAAQARACARRIIQENKSLLLRVYAAYFGITVGMMAISSAFSASPGFSMLWSIGVTFLTIPLVLGLLHVNNMIYYRRPCSVGNLFDFFRNYAVSIKVVGASYIFMLGTMVVLIPILVIAFIPFIGVIAAGWYSIESAVGPGLVLYVLFIILLVALLEMLIASIEMSVYYIALRNRSILFGDLLLKSLRIGFRYLWKYFVLQLTFFGWSLLASLPLGIAAGIATVMLIGGSWISATMLLLAGAFLTLAAATVLNVYIYAASTVFFNTAIDEYEGQTPPPPVSPSGPFSEGDAVSEEEFFVREEPEEESAPSAEETVEHMEAETLPAGETRSVVVLSGGIRELSAARMITQVTRLDITEAMAFLSQTPKTLCDGVTDEEARRIAKLLTDAGAKVEIR